MKCLPSDRYEHRYLIPQLGLINFNFSNRSGIIKEETVCTMFYFCSHQKSSHKNPACIFCEEDFSGHTKNN